MRPCQTSAEHLAHDARRRQCLEIGFSRRVSLLAEAVPDGLPWMRIAACRTNRPTIVRHEAHEVFDFRVSVPYNPSRIQVRIPMPRRPAQIEMNLRPAPRWGGRRENAGRKKSPDSGMPHTPREGFSSTTPAHVTVKLSPAVRSLRTKSVVRALERTFAAGCERSTFRLVHYSLQGNHAHLIVEARDREALGRGMMAIGSRLALAVNRVMGRRKGRVVADRYHSRLLKTPREVQRALQYVLMNARKHAAGTTRTAVRAVDYLLDPASSARWFDGWRSGLTPEARKAPAGLMERPAVARARTWLLRVGWRRHGLLDPAVVPA